MNAFMVYHQNAESYSSRAELPVAVFTNEDEAIAFAKRQPGYGYNVDWFVHPVDLNPEA